MKEPLRIDAHDAPTRQLQPPTHTGKPDQQPFRSHRLISILVNNDPESIRILSQSGCLSPDLPESGYFLLPVPASVTIMCGSTARVLPRNLLPSHLPVPILNEYL